MTEQVNDANMNEKCTKIAADYFHAVQRGEYDSLVIAEAFSELKRPSILYKKRSQEELFLFISSLSNANEWTLNYSPSSNQKQNDNTSC